MQLLETIRYENGRFSNLGLHQERMNRSRTMLLGQQDTIVLQPDSLVSTRPDPGQKGLYKCRIIYDDRIRSIEFVPYVIPVIRTLQLVFHDEISYDHKYLDRQLINRLYDERREADDILIVRKGLVTDTSFANIVCYNGKEWITPVHPLLKGVQRTRLLNEERISTAEIRTSDLRYFSRIRLVNAMMRFEDEVDVVSVFE